MSENRFVFTKEKLDEIEPTGKTIRYYDTHKNAAGLMLQVSPKGAKTFCLRRRIDGKPKTITIERFDAATTRLERVRRCAAEALADLSSASSSEDIAKARLKVTLSSALSDYLTDRGTKSLSSIQGLSVSTASEYVELVDRYAMPLKRRTLGSIKQRDISSLHSLVTAKNGARTADKVCQVMRLIFNYAIKKYTTTGGEPLFNANPVSVLSATKSWNQPRAMRSGLVIPREKLQAWYAALENLVNHKPQRNLSGVPQYIVCSYLFRFTLLTGLRPVEASCLERRQYNPDRKTVVFIDLDAISRIKNARNFELPLSDQAAKLIEGMLAIIPPGCEYIFPGLKGDMPCSEDTQANWMQALVKQTDIKSTRKAARSTFISVARSLGIDPLIVKRLVNHTSAGSGDVTDGYTTSEQTTLREATQKISDFITNTAPTNLITNLQLPQSLIKAAQEATSMPPGSKEFDNKVLSWAQIGMLAERYSELPIAKLMDLQGSLKLD